MPLAKLVEEGYAVASVDYRLSTEAKFPAQIHDLKAAIRFLRGHGGEWALPAQKVVIAGDSAGAHLAALVGVSNGHAELEGGIGNDRGQSSDVQGIISFYGAANLTTILKQSTPHGLSVRVPALDLLLGGQPDDVPALARLASPAFHVDANDPPLLLLHGDQDPQMPINQSHELYGAYKKAGAPVQFAVVHGAAHGGAAFYDAERLAIVMAALSAIGRTAESPTAYQLVPDFPRLPAGWTLGAVSGVATDSKGDVLVFHRGEHPILVFDRYGKFLRSFGEGMFSSAHGLRVDAHDNIWVTDNANHTVVKFSHDGKVLMTLGEKNVAGEDAAHFNKPTDIAFAPNGDFYVSDGYGNSRVVKFNKEGKYLLAWGKKGTGSGEFNLPHAIRLDAAGRVYVGDRENDRVQVFDANGKFLRQFGGFAPFGLFITPDQTLFVADGRANQILKMTLDGKILALWGATGAEPGNFQLPHGLTVARDGAVYVTEINGKRVQKFVPQ
jgi:acetyl esterase/lipase/sugar lactone lactonase YvrE